MQDDLGTDLPLFDTNCTNTITSAYLDRKEEGHWEADMLPRRWYVVFKLRHYFDLS
jgi:hypothetical protein